MMLMSTLLSELARIDGEISRLTRARFACLARCDATGARAALHRIAELKQQRDSLEQPALTSHE